MNPLQHYTLELRTSSLWFHNVDFIHVDRVNVPFLLAGLVAGEVLAVNIEQVTMLDNTGIYTTFEHYIAQQGAQYVCGLQSMLSGLLIVPYILFIVFIFYICFFKLDYSACEPDYRGNLTWVIYTSVNINDANIAYSVISPSRLA